MTRPTRPASARWAILVLTVSALALAGCGRKGGLDLPPQASAQPMGTGAPAADPDAQSAANKGRDVFAPSNGVDEGPPAATRGRKKPFLLDPILD
ncbi:LPS translocon maturation chaperone LptM [Tardiphaga sp. 866_E4_N2_1]|uniref:Lipoprotein n=1 Tax=Tardiphaga robiniae TaxID=943830 RepID=A0A7G6U2W7_9BRAD|nr:MULTISPECIES: lipoprotein [Tardiphaga]NUU40240.1 lipoprotein [Tardiphaga robiniae]QND73349.1 lipoprotein [Tardiphaga robiniae]WPO41623.1 lipoprotein [Tardiphaga sp. 42S5]